MYLAPIPWLGQCWLFKDENSDMRWNIGKMFSKQNAQISFASCVSFWCNWGGLIRLTTVRIYGWRLKQLQWCFPWDLKYFQEKRRYKKWNYTTTHTHDAMKCARLRHAVPGWYPYIIPIISCILIEPHSMSDNIIWVHNIPDSKVRGANMGPIWVLSAPDGPHDGPINLVIRDTAHYGR